MGAQQSGNSRGMKYYMRDFFLNFYFQVLSPLEYQIRENLTGKMLFRYAVSSNRGYYIPSFTGKAFELLLASVLENRSQRSAKVFQLLGVSSETYRVGTYWQNDKKQVDVILEDDTDRESRLIEVKWINEKADSSRDQYFSQIQAHAYCPPEGYRIKYFLLLSRGFTEPFWRKAETAQVTVLQLEDLFG